LHLRAPNRQGIAHTATFFQFATRRPPNAPEIGIVPTSGRFDEHGPQNPRPYWPGKPPAQGEAPALDAPAQRTSSLLAQQAATPPEAPALDTPTTEPLSLPAPQAAHTTRSVRAGRTGSPSRTACDTAPVPSSATHEALRRRPIGVFDSGVGGLTVLHELLVALPHEDFLYLGDTARFPYGSRPPAQLQAFALEIADELVQRGSKLLVVACNSATAAALPALQERYAAAASADPDAIDVITVVGPESQAATVATRNGRVGLLATPATVESGAYERALRQADPHIKLHAVPAADLAPIIQGGFPFDERVVATVREYCQPLKEAKVDTVILGCTHYPLVRPMLQRMLGPEVTLITPGAAIARRVECALSARDLDSPNQGEGDYRFLCTGDAESFRALGTRFLQLPLGHVEHVEVASTQQMEIAG
jgi:glutamate racemase